MTDIEVSMVYVKLKRLAIEYRAVDLESELIISEEHACSKQTVMHCVQVHLYINFWCMGAFKNDTGGVER